MPSAPWGDSFQQKKLFAVLCASTLLPDMCVSKDCRSVCQLAVHQIMIEPRISSLQALSRQERKVERKRSGADIQNALLESLKDWRETKAKLEFPFGLNPCVWRNLLPSMRTDRNKIWDGSPWMERQWFGAHLCSPVRQSDQRGLDDKDARRKQPARLQLWRTVHRQGSQRQRVRFVAAPRQLRNNTQAALPVGQRLDRTRRFVERAEASHCASKGP